MNFDLSVHRGAGAYICGEETALIESLEGKRGQPRIRPLFPASQGAWRKPTVINNVETLSNVPYLIAMGADAYSKIGEETSPGPKIYGVSGHVNKPGVYALPMGTTLREIIYTHCGGIRGGKKLKAVIPGGASTPMLTPDHLDVKMDFNSLVAAGSMLGSGAVMVMDETVGMVTRRIRSSGSSPTSPAASAPPAARGRGGCLQILEKICEGHGEPGDIAILEELSAIIRDLLFSRIWPS